jgi:hypothetical protein
LFKQFGCKECFLIKNLAEKAILIQLSIGKFNTSKRDAQATKDVTSDNGVEKGNAAVVKRLFNNKQFDAINSSATKIRQSMVLQ